MALKQVWDSAGRADTGININILGGIGSSNTQEVLLNLRHHPEEPSGPPFLIQNLKGKCFELISNNYKYEVIIGMLGFTHY